MAGTLLLLFVLLLTGAIYSLGVDAAWLFDDWSNLGPLAAVHGFKDALLFVVSGNSGPSGRPLALLTFLLNAGDWPNNPAAFRWINIGIHLINGILVHALVRSALAQGRIRVKHADAIALVSAAVWLLHPLLVSSGLSAVQRMTLLEAFFVLIGMLLYLHGRRLTSMGRRHGLAVMSAGMACGLVLGTLAKENALLMPFFVSILEVGWLEPDPAAASRVHSAWRWVFVLLPMAFVIGYLGWSVLHAGFASRDFNLAQRLASETVIILQYAKQIIVPGIKTMGPFHDDFPVYGWSSPIPWSSLAALLALTGVAIRFRKVMPGLFVAVLGYLAGQIIESSVVPLELYFEHRNYLPSLFIIVPLVTALWQCRRPVAIAASVAWIAVFAFETWQVTALWGDPPRAGEAWYAYHPHSIRAAQFLGNIDLNEGRLKRAEKLMVKAFFDNEESTTLALQALQTLCIARAPAGEMDKVITKAVTVLPHARFSIIMPSVLNRLNKRAHKGTCHGLDTAAVDRLVAALEKNPKYQINARARAALLAYESQRARDRGEIHRALAFQRRAYTTDPTLSRARALAEAYLKAGDKSDAKAVLEGEKTGFGSRNPIKRLRWSRVLGPLHAELAGVKTTTMSN